MTRHHPAAYNSLGPPLHRLTFRNPPILEPYHGSKMKSRHEHHQKIYTKSPQLPRVHSRLRHGINRLAQSRRNRRSCADKLRRIRRPILCNISHVQRWHLCSSAMSSGTFLMLLLKRERAYSLPALQGLVNQFSCGKSSRNFAISIKGNQIEWQ
ncbi:hypothetical protein BDV23DRAFT_162711 [Aspergillus alliaceus]|uniref:Uncharacterized protein n=1 Tax=Petromyces alliaceus TaxID=209559 RepID=A0A5N7BY31_PETAA|nr:hypothetical protein BDV23DRAFT_162711 [Aspergillus alliaceus]